MNPDHPPAVLLLSGGLDSSTLLAIAKAEGFAVHALSFRYGQRHEQELDAARRVAERYGATEHRVATIDLRLFGGSALTDPALEVPRDRDESEMGTDVPITYVPARNTIFLAHALAYAEVVGARDIFIGVNSLDYSGYPDCRPEFVESFERMANLATRASTAAGARLRIRTPLLHLGKAEIIQRGIELGVDYSLTTSCYDPTDDGLACGHCDACQLRLRGFAAAGLDDPAPYVPGVATRASSNHDRAGRGAPARTSGSAPARGRSYAVKEIFYTLQGEGANAGRPAVFCRFAGCNLWNGREEDRADAICTFCDTDFVGIGPDGGRFGSAEELAQAVAARWPEGAGGAPLVVCTGGEPLLQLDAAAVDALHARGFEVAVETNGTQPPPPGLDWICVSPKAGAPFILTRGDELKLVFPQEGAAPERYEELPFRHFFLQPMDGPDIARNTELAVAYCLAHPRWRLSVQTHKALGIR